MDSVDRILFSMDLPVQLPEQLFDADELMSFPDVTNVITYLPKDLQGHLDLEVTASHKIRDGKIIYRVPLIEGDCLKITVQQRAIVEIVKIEF